MIKSECYYLSGGSWTLFTNVHYPVDVNLTLDETLDNGKISRYIKSSTVTNLLPELTKIKIILKDDSTIVKTFYFCGNEKRNRVSKYLYLHTVNLVESTKLREGYIICGKAVTQPLTGTRISIKTVINDLLATNPFRRFSEAQTFFLDGNIMSRLNTIESPEFRWSSKQTLWECLYEIGKYITAIPRLIPNPTDDT